MKSLALILSFCVFTAGLVADDGNDSAEKQKEILKLIQNTKQLGEFRERVKGANDDMKTKVPGPPSWFWDEVGRDVNVDAYAQWLIGVFDQTLSIEDLRTLNAVFGDQKKNHLVELLIHDLTGKKPGDEFRDAINEFKRLHDRDGADEIVEFMFCPAAQRYSAALGKIDKEGWDETVKLLNEARDRVLARHRPRPAQAAKP